MSLKQIYKEKFQLCVNLLFLLWETTLLKIYWTCNGVGKQLSDIAEGKRVTQRCQVLKIWFRKPFSVFNVPANFITTHEEFVDFGYILSHKVSLYRISITDQIAEFVEFDETVNPFDVRENPIHFALQSYKAVRLIRVPLKDLIRESKSFQTKQKRVVWMIQSLRCGSTAWAQVFASLPEWSVLSEPQHLMWTLVNEHTGMDIEEYACSDTFKDVAEATYRIFLHHLGSCSGVMIKCTVFDQYLLPMITERFPDHQLLYAYRNVLPSAKSFFKFIQANTAYTELKTNVSNTNMVAKFLRDLHTYQYKSSIKALEIVAVPHDVFEWYVMSWCAMTSYVKAAMDDGTEIHGLKYERLQHDARSYLEVVFRHLAIDKTHIAAALTALEHDSQANLPFNGVLHNMSPPWEKTEGAVGRANGFLKFFDLGGLYSDILLPNTL